MLKHQTAALLDRLGVDANAQVPPLWTVHLLDNIKFVGNA